ncbi:hypothetical protein GCM10011575_08240 [Microlunatus endophyticus]|uniref:Pyridoxamine 5'-phosphate oxidase N-terminal domain-containing protein n=1 Tax=Microlunatus endophyticus TaxID=1716077 RepID=A0A917W1Q7_9ACTN|nr:pyridoxamine 5'-phosphate oxidase family protein [Microlunatus endophyticus]GGL52285.1 hypothetical protein GCM10011575_08240 [Microlunatus endophyticus]
MGSTTTDQDLIARMKQRALHLKARQRATNTIAYEIRRSRKTFVAVMAVIGAIVVDGAFVAVERALIGDFGVWRGTFAVFVFGGIFGGLLGHFLLSTAPGRRRLASREARLALKYGADLSAGRRWLEFYFEDEDISPYIPEILHSIENEHRFDSVRAALEAVKQWHYQLDNARSRARALEVFREAAGQTKVVTVASVDAEGRPSARVMNFVTSDQDDLWYLTTAPDSPKVAELDRGGIALVTAQTRSGATISSNQLQLNRSDRRFLSVAQLYRDQVPGYVEHMSDDERQHELVYELRLYSAKIETWTERNVLVFSEPDESPPS